MNTTKTNQEKIEALNAFFFCLENGDSETRAYYEVCREFECTKEELQAWYLELEYIPG